MKQMHSIIVAWKEQIRFDKAKFIHWDEQKDVGAKTVMQTSTRWC